MELTIIIILHIFSAACDKFFFRFKRIKLKTTESARVSNEGESDQCKRTPFAVFLCDMIACSMFNPRWLLLHMFITKIPEKRKKQGKTLDHFPNLAQFYSALLRIEPRSLSLGLGSLAHVSTTQQFFCETARITLIP